MIVIDNIDKLYNMIVDSNYIVAFTGAVVSTDSGLKDFRSKDGLYKKKYEYPAEYMLSSKCFYKDTKLFYNYYKENFNCLNIKPNDTYKLLKKLEDIGKLKTENDNDAIYLVTVYEDLNGIQKVTSQAYIDLKEFNK